MNERMEKILIKKAQEKDILKVTIDPIVKPDVVSSSNPSIYIDGSYFFYTFDGRSLFFSKEQTDPIISVPEETRDVCMINVNGVDYCFTLSFKNKLECSVNGTSVPDKRYCITRNVLQVQKTNDKIYFLFKKDQLYFINECHFDGKKWIGKILHTNIEGKSVELFATDGSFFFTRDTQLYNARGEDLETNADFAHKVGDLVVVGHKRRQGYMFRVLDSNMDEVDNLLIPAMQRGTIKAHGDIIVQQIHSSLYILKVTNEGFATKGCIQYAQDILCFDVKSYDEQAYITLLTSKECGEQTFIVEGNQIPVSSIDFESESDSMFESRPSEFNTSGLSFEARSEPEQEAKSSNSFGDAEDDFFYDSKKSSILREMESVSLADHSAHQPAHKPKNKLLEEVRATLSKRRQSMNEQPSTPLANDSETDKFVKYRSENNIKQENPANASIEQKLAHGPLSAEALGDAQLEQTSGSFGSKAAIIDATHSAVEKSLEGLAPHSITTEREILAGHNGDASVSDEISARKLLPIAKPESKKGSGLDPEHRLKGLTLEQFLAEHRKISLETQKATIAAVQAMLTKTGNTESMIKEVIIKALVPSVEACFNEMRIQILTEIKKLVNSAAEASNPKINSVQKLINTGKINQAIQEFMKLDESDMGHSLGLFSCSSIESADSNILVQFLGKIFNLAKKQPKDIHFRLITACLLDIEVNDLTVENVQNMSVLLRYLKEMDDFDDEKYNELNCLADIIIKKIKRRVKQGSANKSVQ